MSGTTPQETCARAVTSIAALPGLWLRAASRWYLSDPIPPSGQPPYCNGVARYEGAADPGSLLESLQTIEGAAGRRRGEPNAARTLDLDIVAMGDLLRDAPDPVLPHPRAHLRAFVLAPLAEVAPEWRHPRFGRTARELLAALPSQGLRLL